MLYVCVRYVMDVVFCDAWSCKCPYMGSMSVSSCRCYMFVSLHLVAVLNAGRGCNRRPYRGGILQSQSPDCLIGSHECLLLFIPSCCCDLFLTICNGLY